VPLIPGPVSRSIVGPVRTTIPIVLGVAAITAACFLLNAVFAFAIIKPGPPMIRPAFAQARSHLGVILGPASWSASASAW
jgi:hypothetical protein